MASTIRIRKIHVHDVILPDAARFALDALLPLVPLDFIADMLPPHAHLTYFTNQKLVMCKGILPFVAHITRHDAQHIVCGIVNGIDHDAANRLAFEDILMGSGILYYRNMTAEAVGTIWTHLIANDLTASLLTKVGLRTKADIVRFTGYSRHALFPSHRKSSAPAASNMFEDQSAIAQLFDHTEYVGDD